MHTRLTAVVPDAGYVENKNMTELTTLLNDMALNGYGVAWSETYNEYRPFAVVSNDEISDGLEWWHDPLGCASADYETAVRSTYEEMLRQLGP